jgi:hypothetical protein
MEHKFAASIGVLLPAGKFIVDGEGDTLLELVVVVVSASHSVPGDLKTKCNVEIFRDVTFRPVRDIAIWIVNTNRLDSCVLLACIAFLELEELTLPPEECIVADERRDFSIANTEVDRRVDHVGEVRDCVLKIIVLYLHDTSRMLDDRDLGG